MPIPINNTSRYDHVSQMERGELGATNLTPMEKKALVKQFKHAKFQQRTVEKKNSYECAKKVATAAAVLFICGAGVAGMAICSRNITPSNLNATSPRTNNTDSAVNNGTALAVNSSTTPSMNSTSEV
jgi:hypothetical protein